LGESLSIPIWGPLREAPKKNPIKRAHFLGGPPLHLWGSLGGEEKPTKRAPPYIKQTSPKQFSPHNNIGGQKTPLFTKGAVYI